MSKFYLTGNSDSIKTLRTARGHHWVKATAQSWGGSIRVVLCEAGPEGKKETWAEVWVADGSAADGGRCLLRGRLADILKHPSMLIGQ